MRLHHVALKVLELDAAERFYRALLGAEVKARFDDAAGRPRSVWLALEGSFFAIERAEAPLAPKADDGAGWHTVAFSIEPHERALVRERAQRLGAPIVRETPFSLFVRDPEGNVVALSHHPVAAPLEGPG